MKQGVGARILCISFLERPSHFNKCTAKRSLFAPACLKTEEETTAREMHRCIVASVCDVRMRIRVRSLAEAKIWLKIYARASLLHAAAAPRRKRKRARKAKRETPNAKSRPSTIGPSVCSTSMDSRPSAIVRIPFTNRVYMVYMVGWPKRLAITREVTPGISRLISPLFTCQHNFCSRMHKQNIYIVPAQLVRLRRAHFFAVFSVLFF